ncbi:MAG: hypothetical protein IT371_10750 [Deltaproteobacteria bacterium]|nr:hypothetical protein [Deltaproteobacteria bacterium]
MTFARPTSLLTGLGVLATLVLAGSADDAACPLVKPADQLCKGSGGTWMDGACPPSCWPAACGQPVDKICAAVCGKEPVCRCPASAPYWDDAKGCLSASQCPPTCASIGGTCVQYTCTFGPCALTCPSGTEKNTGAGTCPVYYEGCCTPTK